MDCTLQSLSFTTLLSWFISSSGKTSLNLVQQICSINLFLQAIERVKCIFTQSILLSFNKMKVTFQITQLLSFWWLISEENKERNLPFFLFVLFPGKQGPWLSWLLLSGKNPFPSDTEATYGQESFVLRDNLLFPNDKGLGVHQLIWTFNGSPFGPFLQA